MSYTSGIAFLLPLEPLQSTLSNAMLYYCNCFSAVTMNSTKPQAVEEPITQQSKMVEVTACPTRKFKDRMPATDASTDLQEQAQTKRPNEEKGSK